MTVHPKLKWFTRVRSGHAPEALDPDGKFPVFGANGLMGRTHAANVRTGTLLVGRVGACGAVNQAIEAGWATDNALVLTPLQGVVPRYVYYALIAAELPNLATGTAMPLITGTHVLEQRAWMPSAEIQARIANFLDEQTVRIDALIAAKERLTAGVEELRASAIAAAVSVEGVPGWRRTRLKYLVHDIVDTEHKTVPFYEDGEYLVARTTNIKGGRLVLAGAKYTDAAGFEEWTRRAVPVSGDILFTREAPAGEACIVPNNLPLCLGQRTVLVRLNRAKADASFVLWSLYGGLASRFISDLSQGSTVAHFNMPDIGNIPLCKGPLNEQRARAQALEKELNKVDELREHIDSHISRLREYRSSLISAAVTGQLDIGSFQAKLPQAA